MPIKKEAVIPIQEARRFSLTLTNILLASLFLGAVAAAGYFYYQLKWAAQIEKTEEIKSLTDTIGAFIELPTDEEPTLATVTDREKLADQTFFLKAENGDKVLIYSQSGKAILYRPSTKKIIDMTTVNVNTQADADANAETQAPPETEAPPAAPVIIRVALRNGSQTVGVTNGAENQLKIVLPNMAVTSKEDAAKKDYQGTVVVDLTGANAESTQKIAEELGGTVGSLPAGETAPTDADVIVIIGNTNDAPQEKSNN